MDIFSDTNISTLSILIITKRKTNTNSLISELLNNKLKTNAKKKNEKYFKGVEIFAILGK